MSVADLRILVTGGAGFVGSHLCDRLLGDGHEVVALDSFQTGAARNVAHLMSNGRFRLIRHDVTIPFDLAVDRIFNLACPASPPRYQSDPVRTTLTSVLGTLHSLQVAERHGARFLQASTSEVYGDPLVHPQSEEYRGNTSITGPRACYDEGKRCAESLTADYHRQHGVDVRIARIFNTYGPRMDLHDGRVVSNFIGQALLGEPLTIHGDGTQTRSFCYVDDLVDGLVTLMESDVGGEPVNLGNPEELAVRELAEHVLELTGSRSRIERRPLPQDDPRRRCPDVSRAARGFGFSAKTPLREGLLRTIDEFRGRMEIEGLLVGQPAAPL